MTFSNNTTFAGTTIADLGTVTTADINGGTIDGATIGGASAGAGTFTTLTATTLGGVLNANSKAVTNLNVDSGTLDGVQIGGTTATGELIVNNSSDAADGLGSQGTAGQILESAGAGSNPTWADRDFNLISNTTVSSATNSGDITISEDKIYKIVIEGSVAGGTDIEFRVNSDSTASYEYASFASVGGSAEHNQGTGQNGIECNGTTPVSASQRYLGEFTMRTRSSGDRVHITGTYSYDQTATGNVGGRWTAASAPTSFEFAFGSNFSGNVWLYEYAIS